MDHNLENHNKHHLQSVQWPQCGGRTSLIVYILFELFSVILFCTQMSFLYRGAPFRACCVLVVWLQQCKKVGVAHNNDAIRIRMYMIVVVVGLYHHG